MCKNIITSVIAVFMICGTLCAATADFRGGIVLSAEISSKVPKVDGLKVETVNPVYARLVFVLHPERKVSIHDYALNVYGRDFKAVAIARNNEAWKTDGSAFDNIRDTDRFALLFVLDGSVTGKRSVEKLQIVSCPDPEGRRATVNFKNLNGGSFPSVTSIPKSGSVVK